MWVVDNEEGKVVKSEGECMPDGNMMMNIEEGGYKYLGILDADSVKHEKMKSKERIHQKSEKYTRVKVKWRK